MTETRPELDVTELKRDIPGERVADAHTCDYCGAEVEVGEPVLYEVIRIADMPNPEQLFNPPPGWFADAIRCRNCDIDELTPASDGFDEALVMVHLAESNDVLSIDASRLSSMSHPMATATIRQRSLRS